MNKLPRKQIMKGVALLNKILRRKIRLEKRFTLSQACFSLNITRFSKKRKANRLNAVIGRHIYQFNKQNYILRCRYSLANI
jgi:hypothetical protein